MATLFHITTEAAWRAARARGAYDGDTLASEGFIHCSLAGQVAEVANRLFAGREDLVLLVIDDARVTPEIRYENTEGGETLYPHVYGPLDADAVVEARPYRAGADGRFVEVS